MPLSFVTASATGLLFNGEPFPINGVNCYFLAYCSDFSRRAAMSVAKQMGSNVIRCWAFLSSDECAPGSAAFQYLSNGSIAINHGPDGLERLDALIKAAEDLDLKLILPLVNHWPDLSGMPLYVKWLSPGSDVTAFYRHPAIRAAYKDWVTAVLTRRNTLTGRLYSEEPAILAWELTNEARCPIPGGRELLLDWITEMAGFVKQHDANHLLALGDEGFFYKAGSGHLYDGRYGVDWLANLAVRDIDFGTFHFYPQDWGYGKNLEFGRKWILDHVQAAKTLGKPALLEEFGLKLDNNLVPSASERNDWFGKWTDTVRQCGGAGQLLWMLGHPADDTSGYRDSYVTYGEMSLKC